MGKLIFFGVGNLPPPLGRFEISAGDIWVGRHGAPPPGNGTEMHRVECAPMYGVRGRYKEQWGALTALNCVGTLIAACH